MKKVSDCLYDAKIAPEAPFSVEIDLADGVKGN